MASSYDPRNRRTRRSLAGRPVPRARLAPGMLGAPPQRSQLGVRLMQALLLMGVLAGLALVLSVATAYGAYAQLADSLKPRLDAIDDASSFQTTRLYDRNGVLLYEFFGAGKRTHVAVDQIATSLISATIAIEDQTFFENQGVDFSGIARTLLTSLAEGEETGGASTITQQLIKLVLLSDEERAYENRYQRKVTEIILAQELSERYSKDEILELYLNEIYYGNLAYGIEAAADVYFDTQAKSLTLAQSALLAGLPQLPTVYDPINYLDGGALTGVQLEAGWLAPEYELPNGTPPPKWRQVAVLRQMVDENMVSDQQARQAAAENLQFASQEVPLNAPHFVFFVRKQLEEQFGPQFANQGLTIYTTLDLALQRMVQQKAAERIAELEERNIHNASVVVLQPNTGQILAMVGSIDYNSVKPTNSPGEQGNVLDGQVNVAVRERQPGSALKPFTYLAAMEQGMTPETVIWDVPTKFPLIAGQWYEPKNYNSRWNGPVRMRTALANSLNMPAVKALKFAGIDNTIDLLHRAGISTLNRGAGFYGLSLTLGGGEVTPLDLTAAYNTLASGGRYYPPAAILRVVGSDGATLQELKPGRPVPALNADHVAIITDMMSDDNAREAVWGLNSKLKLTRPAAVKTGTSNDWRDAWAVGFTPYVTVGVWSGNNNNEPTAKVESLTGGGVIWHNIMEELFVNPRYQRLLAEPYPDGRLPLEFAKPSWLVQKPICRLPGPYGNYNRELFTPDMVNDARIPAALPGVIPAPTTAPAQQSDGCSLYEELTVARIGEPESVSLEVRPEGANPSATYCLPQPGDVIPPAVLETISLWKLPPPDPSEQISYRWEGMGARVDDRVIVALRPEQIQPCTFDQLAVFAPPDPGAVRMPDLQKFGENQAKEILAALGITDVFVDYQTRERIPDVFDTFSPYAVVSTLPVAGEWVTPGQTVVLGVRSPE
jgi:peptidoglycan glycosyltransferase